MNKEDKYSEELQNIFKIPFPLDTMRQKAHNVGATTIPGVLAGLHIVIETIKKNGYVTLTGRDRFETLKYVMNLSHFGVINVGELQVIYDTEHTEKVASFLKEYQEKISLYIKSYDTNLNEITNYLQTLEKTKKAD